MDQRRKWEQLSRFESYDYVGKWYLKRNRRQLSSGRTREINAYFVQGREYFASAAQSALSVRSLLLYYGVLSLSRGAILLLDPTKSGASLKPSHGLDAVNWQRTLAGGISHVLELEVRATNGTFVEFCRATGNCQATAWWANNRNVGNYSVKYPEPQFLRGDNHLILDDLLSRDNRIMSIYSETTGRKSRVHVGEVFADTVGLEISVFMFGGYDSDAAFRNAFKLDPAHPVSRRMASRRLPVPNYHFRLDGPNLNTLKPLLPATQYAGGDGMFIIEPFPNGDKLSEIIRTFLMSYYLGMLVRYFPSHWISLLRNDKGDNAQPVLIAAVNDIELHYPDLIAHILG